MNNDLNLKNSLNLMLSLESSALTIQKQFKKLETCSICLKYVIRKYQYCHSFHKECITKWTSLENYNCPMCREPMNEITDDLKVNNLLNRMSKDSIHELLMVSKNKLNKINMYKKKIINTHIYSLIKKEANNLNLSSIEYILNNELNIQYELNKDEKNKKIIHYLKKRIFEFTKGPYINNINPVKYILLQNYKDYSIILYHIKKTLKMCKLLLCIFNKYYSYDYETVLQAKIYIYEELPRFLDNL